MPDVPTSDRARGPVRTLALLAAVLATAAVALLVPAVPALAHTELTGAAPAAGDTLAQAPDAVVLTFNQDVQSLGTEIVVTGPDGSTASTAATVTDGPVVTRALVDARPAGTYTVTWRVVSADGHPVSGELTFSTARPAGAEEPATPAPEDGATAAVTATDAGAEAPEDLVDGLSGGTRTAVFVLIAIAVLTGVVVTLVRMRRRP